MQKGSSQKSQFLEIFGKFRESREFPERLENKENLTIKKREILENLVRDFTDSRGSSTEKTALK